MLNLKRRVDERVDVIDEKTGEKLSILVCNYERGEVTLGITASKRFRILRDDTVKRTPPFVVKKFNHSNSGERREARS